MWTPYQLCVRQTSTQVNSWDVFTGSLSRGSLFGLLPLLFFKPQVLALIWLLGAGFRLCLNPTSVTMPSAPAARPWTESQDWLFTHLFSPFPHYHPGLYHTDLDDYNSFLLHTLLQALPLKSVLTQPCFHCADSQSPPRLCSCLSLSLRPFHLPRASCLSSSPVPVVRGSQAFPECSGHWGSDVGVGVGGEGVQSELRQQVTWPSKREHWKNHGWNKQGERVP